MKWIVVYVAFISVNVAVLASPVNMSVLAVDSPPKNSRSQATVHAISENELMLNDHQSDVAGPTSMFDIYAPEYDFENQEPVVKAIDTEQEMSRSII